MPEGDMATRVASAGVLIFQLYLLIGVLAAVALQVSGLKRLDPAVTESSRGFRVLIFPGLVALWPLMLKRWLSGVSEPPEESSAHRAAARRGRS